eukprot:COSAG04_NODE_21569_length_371_cov_0.764706_1_plen_25_part_10
MHEPPVFRPSATLGRERGDSRTAAR